MGAADVERLDWRPVGLDSLYESTILEILPSVLDHEICRGRSPRSFYLVGQIEVTQVIPAEFMEIIGEHRFRLPAHGGPFGSSLTDLLDSLAQAHVIDFVVGEVIAHAPKSKRAQVEGVKGRGLHGYP